MRATLGIFRLAFRTLAVAVVATAALDACSGSSSVGDGIAPDDGAKAGSSTGGASTGGSSTGGASTGGSSGSGGANEGCSLGCPDGTCFQGLDGTRACVTRPTDDHRETCGAMDPMCCTEDAECTNGTNGRCLSRIWMYNGCGGVAPFGNACYYDACTTDADCPAVQGAEFAACVPAGALGATVSICVNGGCRTDADCTTHPGGTCSFGEAQTHGTCARRKVFFCAYPSDPCGTTNAVCSPPLVCLPDDSYDGRVCAMPPPAYP